MGIVLSGTGSDGTEGLRAIKAAGGVTLAQEPQSAKFAGMPESAVAAAVVDFSLRIPELAEELVRLSTHSYIRFTEPEPFTAEEDQAALHALFGLVRSATGIDYSFYKDTTVQRRLARRMALHKVAGVRGYLDILQSKPSEMHLLCEDLLIHVTSFFRDPSVFDLLKEHIFPKLLTAKGPDRPIRMWVVGCSTGEEAYSLAIAFLEFQKASRASSDFQIFGSDISERAIETARAGFYAESSLRDLSPDRMRAFFRNEAGGHRIAKHVRDRCVFVRHDVARDPPFSKLDLVSCRNVLIYFNRLLQARVLALLHYALKPTGYLLLGRAESVSSRPILFDAADNSNRIYARSALPSTIHMPLTGSAHVVGAHSSPTRSSASASPPLGTTDAAKHVDNLLLAAYAPGGVVVNERLEILQFRGRIGPYLEPAPGQPQVNLLKMAREGLLGPLRTALSDAKRSMTEVRRRGIRIQDGDGRRRTCDIVVVPVAGLPEPQEKLFIVLFEGGRAERIPREPKGRPGGSKRLKAAIERDARETSRELSATREYLQSLTEEHQQTNDALASANEELMSANEELQSMNEELETAKEELQSTNEELTTVNDELQSRNRELGQTNSDLLNVLNCVDIPIVILDLERRIRRFTPSARALLNILPTDLGRALHDIRGNVVLDGIEREISIVLQTAMTKEAEVQDRHGRWHRMHIRPYTSVDDKVEGVVISFVDIDPLKRAVTDAERAQEYAASLVEAVKVPLVVLDREGIVRSANVAFYDLFGGSRSTTEGHDLFMLGGAAWDVPDVRMALGALLERGTQFPAVSVRRTFPGFGGKTLSVSARAVGTGTAWLLLALEDITERDTADVERSALLERSQLATAEAERANDAKDLFLATLSHELRTPLNSLLLQAQFLARGELDTEKVKVSAERIQRAANMQVRLIDDLLDASRIVSGKLTMELRTLSLATVLGGAIELVASTADKRGVTIESSLKEVVGRISGDPMRLQQVFTNLLANAIKFTGKGGRVLVTVENEPNSRQVRVRVSDTGIGFSPELRTTLFDRFTQADSALTRTHGGLGLGLAIVRYVVEAHGGTVGADSPGKGKGATFIVTLPLLLPATMPPTVTTADVHAAPAAADQGELSGLRILVVEDDRDSRETLLEMLAATGARVSSAGTAEEAFRAIQELVPDLLVSDVAMPEEDGYSLIRRIRALGVPQGGAVPALALTALAGTEDERRALSAGFQMHLAKPVDFLRLQSALLKLRRGHAPAAVARTGGRPETAR